MWPFKKTAIDKVIDVELMPEELAIEYWRDLDMIGRWLYQQIYESQRYLPSDKRKILTAGEDVFPLRGLIESLGAVGRLEQFPNEDAIYLIESYASVYNQTLWRKIPNNSISIHPNIRNFLAAPENITQPILYTLFRKLSGRRLDRGHMDPFRNGIADDLFSRWPVVSGVDGHPQVWKESDMHVSLSGSHEKMNKEFNVWSMSVLPLTYEYFDAMKVAAEYARVRPLEEEVPAICVHPMCRKKFKIDRRITDLFKFSFWDRSEFIATFCSDAHALAARENGISSLRAHVDFVSNLNEFKNLRALYATSENQLQEHLEPILCVAGSLFYTKYPLCKQPFYVEFHRLLHSVYDDSTWDSRRLDENILTPLEIATNVCGHVVANLGYWLDTFTKANLYVTVRYDQFEKEKEKYQKEKEKCQKRETAILNMIEQILRKKLEHYRQFPLAHSFPKYY